jgi:alpha-tubulin suppressor-like RCC1 family protein
MEVAMGSGFPGFQTLATGWYHTCGADLDGKAYCWGKNGNGQLGNNDYDVNNGVPTPTEVYGVTGFTSLAAGAYHTCGITNDDTPYCWGRAGQGQVGFSETSTLDRHSPTLVFGGHSFRVLSAGSLHTCGLTPDGEAWCWGDDAGWQLGQGVLANPYVDLRIPATVKTTLRFGRKN